MSHAQILLRTHSCNTNFASATITVANSHQSLAKSNVFIVYKWQFVAGHLPDEMTHAYFHQNEHEIVLQQSFLHQRTVVNEK